MLLVRSLLIVGLAVAGLATGLPRSIAESPQSKTDEAAVRRASVVNFENEATLDALAARGHTVVFFFASWCPNCRATVAELNTRWADVQPEITLVVADYDKERALKARYGVTYQDTFVLLDQRGAAIKSWNGGGVDGLNANAAF